MTGLDARVAALAPNKRALYAKLLAQRSAHNFPISLSQEGMWFLQQLDPSSAAYVMPAALRLTGPVHVELLARAVNEVVARHESLRTTFPVQDGRPVQSVLPRLVLGLPQEDLRGGDVEEALQERISTVIREPFVLDEGPLVRVRLLQVDDSEHVLVVTMHHLISDGWSTGILFSEVATLYEASVTGGPARLPELALQYGDFAIWQREQFDGDAGYRDIDFWRDHLAGAPAALDLPTDRPRPAVHGFDGGSVQLSLDAKLMADLTTLARQEHATTFMALLAVFNVLLHRHSGQDSVVVGVPSATRERPELEPVIGYFLNLLPIRTDLDGDPTFRQVLARVRESAQGAYAHQGTPFDKVVEALRPPRDLSRTPLFQACFSYQNDPMPTNAMGGLSLSRMPLTSGASRFDLEFQSFHDGGGLTGSFDYDRALFDQETIERLAGQFRHLAELAVAQPDTPVDRLSLLTGKERHEVLAHTNDTARDWPVEDGWIHRCFEARVRQAPQAEAVRFDGESLSYAELNSRANRLARRLCRLGVDRDVVVGVAMERSLDLVVSLLAVVKAGGAYLPLDPGYPRARLEYMLSDAAPQVVLTQRGVLDGLGDLDGHVLCLEELAAELVSEPEGDLEVEHEGKDLAYVIYTSGSTGRPKGVMNTHEAIRNRLLWMQEVYQLNATDRVLQKTPFSFDVSVWEFFWPLMSGATLVVARPGEHKDPAALFKTILREEITTLHFVPSMLQGFLREPGIEELAGLRRVICSGEALSRDLQDQFFARSQAQLHNLYGPTEAAVDVTSWACRREPDPRPVPIGYPIANTQIHVLDRFLQPVPAGVPGELCIGGVNVARGYLGKPALTDERFIKDPFGQRPNARLYRTGDLARRRADGALEYLGRLDRQVKLRGFRIELGEIESALTDHPDVRQAVVVARTVQAGDVRLVGYLTGEGSPGSRELAAHLAQRLPEYMVPATFVILDELPLTPNGKVDEAALPLPDFGHRGLDTAFVEPRDGTEGQIAAAWQEVLGVDRVGLHDNFFELGGHSLLMPVLRDTLVRSLGREISLIELFQYPTVGSMAEFLHAPPEQAADALAGAHARAESRRNAEIQRRHSSARRANARKS